MTATTNSPRRFRPWYLGIVMMLAGAVVVVVGAVQTTTAGTSCPANTVLISKFDWDSGLGQYVLDSETTNQVTVAGDATQVTWSSTTPIAAIVVKGSQTIWYWYPPGPPGSTATSGSFTNDGLKTPSDQIAEISNILFCGPTTPPTTEPTTPPTGPTTPPTGPTTPPTGPTTPPTGPTTPPTGPTTPPTGPTTPPTGPTTPPTGPTTPPTGPTTPPTGPTTPPTGPTTPPTQPGATTTAAPLAGTTTTLVASQAATSTSIVGGVGGSLPTTGSPSALLITLGALLMAAGVTLTVIGRARDRRAG